MKAVVGLRRIGILLSGVLFGLMPLLTAAASEGRLKIHFISAGYGDAILLEHSSGAFVLIDGGDDRHVPEVMDYLQKTGVGALEAVILTHPHSNHFAALPDVFAHFPVGTFYTNGDEAQAEEGMDRVREAAGWHNVPAEILRRGNTLNLLPEVVIHVLHPKNLDGSANENALALRLTFQATNCLLTADIPPAQQTEIIRTFSELAGAQCVQIPHHGGELSEEFIEFFHNRGVVLVASTGENPYGKPLTDAWERFGEPVLRTDQGRAVVLESDGETWTAQIEP